MTEPYLEPSDEDLEEFGKLAQQAAWANLCWSYTQQGSLTGAGAQ